MKRLISTFDDASFHVRLNLILILVWTFIFIPTILIWRESVIWIVCMSWYANWVGHVSAWQGAKAELEARALSDDDIKRIADEVEKRMK